MKFCALFGSTVPIGNDWYWARLKHVWAPISLQSLEVRKGSRTFTRLPMMVLSCMSRAVPFFRPIMAARIGSGLPELFTSSAWAVY